MNMHVESLYAISTFAACNNYSTLLDEAVRTIAEVEARTTSSSSSSMSASEGVGPSTFNNPNLHSFHYRLRVPFYYFNSFIKNLTFGAHNDYEQLLRLFDQILYNWRGSAEANIEDYVWITMRCKIIECIGARILQSQKEVFKYALYETSIKNLIGKHMIDMASIVNKDGNLSATEQKYMSQLQTRLLDIIVPDNNTSSLTTSLSSGSSSSGNASAIDVDSNDKRKKYSKNKNAIASSVSNASAQPLNSNKRKLSSLSIDKVNYNHSKKTKTDAKPSHGKTGEKTSESGKAVNPENIEEKNYYCNLCKKGTYANKLLLCESCDSGYHTFCLKPALSSIPKGDWFCPNCVSTRSNAKRTASSIANNVASRIDASKVSALLRVIENRSAFAQFLNEITVFVGDLSGKVLKVPLALTADYVSIEMANYNPQAKSQTFVFGESSIPSNNAILSKPSGGNAQNNMITKKNSKSSSKSNSNLSGSASSVVDATDVLLFDDSIYAGKRDLLLHSDLNQERQGILSMLSTISKDASVELPPKAAYVDANEALQQGFREDRRKKAFKSKMVNRENGDENEERQDRESGVQASTALLPATSSKDTSDNVKPTESIDVVLSNNVNSTKPDDSVKVASSINLNIESSIIPEPANNRQSSNINTISSNKITNANPTKTTSKLALDPQAFTELINKPRTNFSDIFNRAMTRYNWITSNSAPNTEAAELRSLNKSNQSDNLTGSSHIAFSDELNIHGKDAQASDVNINPSNGNNSSKSSKNLSKSHSSDNHNDNDDSYYSDEAPASNEYSAKPNDTRRSVKSAVEGQKQRRVFWTREQETALRQGVRRYEPGNWSVILADPDFRDVLKGKNNQQLKDKYRNLCKS